MERPALASLLLLGSVSLYCGCAVRRPAGTAAQVTQKDPRAELKGSYIYADGSGLSRYNMLTADLLVRIFRFMYRHEYFQQFYDALPVAGVDGTIYDRMKTKVKFFAVL